MPDTCHPPGSGMDFLNTEGTVEIRVGPPTITVHAGEHYLVCQPDATMRRDRQQGYFVSDTRLVSDFTLRLSDTSLTLVNSSAIQPFSSRFEFVNAEIVSDTGTIEKSSIHLRLDRTIGAGVHDDYDLTNYSKTDVQIELQIGVESDFADLFDVKGGRLVRRGCNESKWLAQEARLTTIHRNKEFCRGLSLQVDRYDSRPHFANATISFMVTMGPKEHWHTCLLWMPIVDDGEPGQPIRTCHAILEGDTEGQGQRLEWAKRVTDIRTNDVEIDAVVSRAVHDLAALRIHRRDEHARSGRGDAIDDWVPGAGIPWFVSLFGRDTLVVSLQTMVLSPRIGRATLRALAAVQGDEYEDDRDVQPGKIEHEWRHGELAFLGEVPQRPYYGSHDATSLFVWVAGELWRWTGDRAAMDELRPNVERALVWIDTDGDMDGDGLQEYQTRAGEAGYYNQGWKDAGDAIVHSDGSRAELPLALCELQGYVVAAKRSWARVVEEAFDDKPRARRLVDEANRLSEAIEERFWWDDEKTYYLGLDGGKRPIESVTSNPGHLLWSEAIPAERAQAVVHRLMAEDMWSGWGVRTLSARHPSYNPFSYQLGSIWPHDNAILADGFHRYGYHDEGWRIARSLFDAARLFRSDRLPEVFAGIQRDPGSFPAQYLGANVPQAWASGAIIHFLSSFIGARPDASNGVLDLRPALPPWLTELRLSGLRLGHGACDLRITSNDTSAVTCRGGLRVNGIGRPSSISGVSHRRADRASPTAWPS